MAKVLHLSDYQKNVLIKVLPAPAQAQCLIICKASRPEGEP